jgi:hypothetical protein
MPRQKPPSRKLLAQAAELRVAGAEWKTVAREVNRAVRTVYYWPRKYPERWARALQQAERLMTAQSDSESVNTLRRLLLSSEEKVRWRAARALIARRLDRDKLELAAPPPDQHVLSPEAALLAAQLEEHSDEEHAATFADLFPSAAAPPA